MGLRAWCGDNAPSVEEEIRVILRAAGAQDVSKEACKMWARQFMREWVKDWTPGKLLAPEQCWKVGQAFLEVLATAKAKQRGRA